MHMSSPVLTSHRSADKNGCVCVFSVILEPSTIAKIRKMAVYSRLAFALVLPLAALRSSAKLLLDAPLDSLDEACQIADGRHPSRANCSV